MVRDKSNITFSGDIKTYFSGSSSHGILLEDNSYADQIDGLQIDGSNGHGLLVDRSEAVISVLGGTGNSGFGTYVVNGGSVAFTGTPTITGTLGDLKVGNRAGISHANAAALGAEADTFSGDGSHVYYDVSAKSLTQENTYPTVSRPVLALVKGTRIYDSTVNSPLWWNGTAWQSTLGSPGETLRSVIPLGMRSSNNTGTPLVVGGVNADPSLYARTGTVLTAQFAVVLACGASPLTVHAKLVNITDSLDVVTLNLSNTTALTALSASLVIGSSPGQLPNSSKIYEVVITTDSTGGSNSVELYSASLVFINTIS